MTCLRRRHPGLKADSACELFGFTRQAYNWHVNRRFKEEVKEGVILDAVSKIRSRHPRMGGRKLKVVLRRDYGLEVGRDRLFDILERNRMLVKRRHRHRRTTFSAHGLRTYPNIIKDLTVSRPDEVWVSDITYLYVEGKSFYVFLLTDLYSRKIVGWKVSDNMLAVNAVDALKMALRGRMPQYRGLPLIHHSDRGSQYCSNAYVSLLRKSGCLISMTETGDPLDNAVAERINGVVKNEYLYPLQVTADGLERKIGNAIRNYNRERPHMSLAWSTPENIYRTGTPVCRKWKNYYPQRSNVNTLD